jgi:arylsulfatase A-like enzyme
MITPAEEDSVDIEHQKQLETMLAVDRAVRSLIEVLTATGRLDNTVVIFTSDNGLAWGEDRLGMRGGVARSPLEGQHRPGQNARRCGHPPAPGS